MLEQILWKSRDKWQIIGAGVGIFIGLFLLLLSLQTYQDFNDILSGNGEGKEQYVLINKTVNIFNTLGAKSTFSEKEIKNIESQSFVETVGTFRSNQFKVSATIERFGFRTELFFEAVPDQFVDVEGDFFWEEGDTEVPIVLSRDYLALYNFGFAPSQGLPQFTASTIKLVSFDLILRNGFRNERMTGRIVGFSDQINSILVPQDFLNWANQRYGNKSNQEAARLILKTNNPYSEKLSNYLEDNGYEVSRGKLIGGELKVLLSSILGAIAFIGFIIILLSVLVFVLAFQLLLSKSSEDIRLLSQLGYKYMALSQILIKRLSLFFGGILLLTILGLFLFRWFWVDWFHSQSFQISSSYHWTIYVTAILLGIGIFLIIRTIIIKNVMRLAS